MIHIIGVGGVGFWVATALAREGMEFTVWDADNLTGGLGHMRLPAGSPTSLKVDLLRGFLLVSMRNVPPTTEPRFFTGLKVQEGDLVVDCTDATLEARGKFYRASIKRGARYLRVSYDGREGVVAISEGIPIADNPQGGYAAVPNLALSFLAGGLGASTVIAIARGFVPEFVEFQISVDGLVGVVRPEPVVEEAEEPPKPKGKGRKAPKIVDGDTFEEAVRA